MRFSVLAPLLLATTSGCFSGLVELEGLDDEASPSDPAGVDASSFDSTTDRPTFDGLWPEGAADGSPADTSDVLPPDGPTDAAAIDDAMDAADAEPDVVDAGPDVVQGWCDSHGSNALFCDDFDGAQAWDDYVASANAQLAVSTAFATSSPRSLRFHADAFSQVGLGEAYRTKTLSATTNAIVFSLQIRLEELSSKGEAIPSQLILRDGAGVESRLSLLVGIPYDVTLEIERIPPGQPASYTHYPLSTLPTEKAWARMDYVVSTAPREVSLYVDGVPALQGVSATKNVCSGIQRDDVCCAASCGGCGGPGCSSLPGGSSACCAGTIRDSAVGCADSPPPCVITDYEVVAEIRVGGCYVAAPSDSWTVYFDDVLVR